MPTDASSSSSAYSSWSRNSGLPLGHPVAGVAEGRRHVAPEPLAHEPRDRRLAQRARAQHGDRRVGGELGEQPPVLALLGVARGHDQQDRQLLDAPRQVADEGDRARVGPVQVVDDGEQRPAVGDVDEEPEQPVQELELGLRALPCRRELRVEHRTRAVGRLGEQLVALLGRGGADQALEELAHDAEGEALLDLRAAGPQHLDAGVARPAIAPSRRSPSCRSRARRRRPPRDRGRAGSAPRASHQRAMLVPALEQPLQRERPREPVRRWCGRHSPPTVPAPRRCVTPGCARGASPGRRGGAALRPGTPRRASPRARRRRRPARPGAGGARGSTAARARRPRAAGSRPVA